jgi:DNA-directed RNA polymerase specialized sigma24 family protein
MLVNQGVSAGEIASVLDISLSEVDLAINLLSRQKKPGSSH